jgi:hypothetical protein
MSWILSNFINFKIFFFFLCVYVYKHCYSGTHYTALAFLGSAILLHYLGLTTPIINYYYTGMLNTYCALGKLCLDSTIDVFKQVNLYEESKSRVYRDFKSFHSVLSFTALN